MRAIVVCTGGEGVVQERAFAPMLPILDRPFVHHLVDHLVEHGANRIEFVLHHFPEKVEGLLEDGTRWGCQFRYHLAQDPGRPYRCLRVLSAAEPGEKVLLVHAEVLIALSRWVLPEPLPEWPVMGDAGSPHPDERPVWTGWAWVPTPMLVALAATNPDREGLEAGLRSRCPVAAVPAKVEDPLQVRNEADVLAASLAVLTGQMPGLLFGGVQVEPGIWLSRNVSLHPTARLEPPVYIAENCRIERGVRLGPRVVVGRNSVLDEGCLATEAVVMPGSYVGQGLELEQVVVDRNRLFSVRLGAEVTIADDFLLGSAAGGQLADWVRGGCSRLVALVLLLGLLPVLLVTVVLLALFRRGPVLRRRRIVRLPAPAEETSWKTFTWWGLASGTGPARPGIGHLLLRFIPGLANVVLGQLRFTGVEPRSEAELLGLGGDWRALCLRTKAGLVTEAAVLYGADANDDERYSAEAFYAVRSGWWYDLRLLARYLFRVLGGGRDGAANGRNAEGGDGALPVRE